MRSPLGTWADMLGILWVGAPTGWDMGHLFSDGKRWCGFRSGHEKSLELGRETEAEVLESRLYGEGG